MRISWEYSGNIKSTCCIPYFETNAGGRRSNAARKRTTKMLSSSASPTVAAAQNLLPETDWFVQGKYILYVYNCMYTCIYIYIYNYLFFIIIIVIIIVNIIIIIIIIIVLILIIIIIYPLVLKSNVAGKSRSSPSPNSLHNPKLRSRRRTRRTRCPHASLMGCQNSPGNHDP